MMQRIVLIGPGRVGSAVCKRLHDAGYQISGIIGRNQQRAEDAASFIGCDPAVATTDLEQARQGELILLAVPDDQLGSMAQKLLSAIELPKNITLVHFSGLHPASIMATDESTYAMVSIHPLLSFADRETATTRLNNCPCAVEGDDDSLPLAEELVKAIGGRSFYLPTEAKALYHAAACIASNYLVTITATARDLLIRCGIDKEQAMELLAPIQSSTNDNLLKFGPEAALTGPIARGDIGTVKSHIEAIKGSAPGLADLYCSLGEQTIELAVKSGRLNEELAFKLQALLADHDREHSIKP